MARQSPGGIAAKAIAGIELALWDVKAKALGVPVSELFGGPLRLRQRVYWSHCGTSRAMNAAIDRRAARSARWTTSTGSARRSSGAATGRSRPTSSIRAIPRASTSPGSAADPGTTDQTVTSEMIRHIETLLGTFRRAVGPDVGIALDLNFNMKPEAAIRICRALAGLDMMWVEIDMYDAAALREVKDAAPMPICSGENLYGLRGYRPFFEARAMDVVMVDVPWNGFAQSRKVAELAETYELNVAPHNYYSHLSTLHSLHLCATVPNVRIMEIDVDDVPWKDELVDAPPVDRGGRGPPADAARLGRRSGRGRRPEARLGARPPARLLGRDPDVRPVA